MRNSERGMGKEEWRMADETNGGWRMADDNRSYAVGRFPTATDVEMRGLGNLRSDTEGLRTTHAPQIDSRLCTSVKQLHNS